jgi:hypothetical protein
VQGHDHLHTEGDIAGILSFASAEKELPATAIRGRQVEVVAGARNHLNLLFDAPHIRSLEHFPITRGHILRRQSSFDIRSGRRFRCLGQLHPKDHRRFERRFF